MYIILFLSMILPSQDKLGMATHKEGHIMSMHESGEMYLEAILVLSKKSSLVRSVDVGEYLGYSKPSVSRAMGILRKENYIIVQKNGGLELTDKGRTLAETIYERHTVLSAMLQHLGVSEETASADACRMEHVISDESFQAIKQHASKL